MYDVLDLAKYIVTKCSTEGSPISNLQLQKILYYIQKEFLNNDKLAFDADIEAWRFGPVVPCVYYNFCSYGSMPIDDIFKTPIKEDSVVDEIIVEKRRLNPWEMVSETHKENGAWHQTYKDGSGNGNVIPIDLIKSVG